MVGFPSPTNICVHAISCPTLCPSLSCPARQVRYEHAHCSLAEAHRVIEDFVSLCLCLPPGHEPEPEPAAAAPPPAQPTASSAGKVALAPAPAPASAAAVAAAAAAGGGGTNGGGSGLRIRPVDPPAVAALLGAAAAEGKDEEAAAVEVPAGGLAGPKLRVQQYVHLFSSLG